MSAYEVWCTQKEKLKTELSEAKELHGVTPAVRHALSQTEQVTLASFSDDLLRQQAGILFACLKTSAGLLDVPIAAKVWEARAQEEKKRGKPTWLLFVLAGVAQALCWWTCYRRGELLLWIVLAAVFVLVLLGLLLSIPEKRAPKREDDMRVTLHPDIDKLFYALDAQMKAIDRYLNDFAYLNESLKGKSALPDARTVGLVADMLEALYECGDEVRQPALRAADKVLHDFGVEAVPYSPQDSALFTVLPSKTETSTIAPAIVSAEDRRVLRRGTAAVRPEGEATDAAE